MALPERITALAMTPTTPHPGERAWWLLFMLLSLAGVSLLTVVGVSIYKVRDIGSTAEHEVASLRERLAAGKYVEIYLAAGTAVQNRYTEADFIRHLAAAYATT